MRKCYGLIIWLTEELKMASDIENDPSELEQNSEKSEPAGVDNATGDGWGDYPLDAVFVRTETRSVNEVVTRINSNRYILDPDFQRVFVWNQVKQSKLIESCIMRIPLPVFYVAEARDGRIIVVDGLQRLTTFTRFLNGNLKLKGLSDTGSDGSHQLEGKTFEELPINLQERVLDTQLTMYILDAKAPERARLDIFERVNSGATLTRQQMRNALYNGPATQWLKLAAEGEAFQTATAGTLDNRTMRDREAINRFCAFYLLGRESYQTSDMDTFLASGLKKLASLPESSRDRLRLKFDAAMELSERLFHRHAFRKSLAAEVENAARSVINISLFEVTSVLLAKVAETIDSNEENKLRDLIVDLLRDDDFARSITYSTNSTQAVQNRFWQLEFALQKMSGDPDYLGIQIDIEELLG